jgi:CubicO group peptidase (beta-lactamase class C family)
MKQSLLSGGFRAAEFQVWWLESRRAVVLAAFFAATLCGAVAASDMAFPGATWEEATPQSQGIDPEKLKRAIAHLEAHTGKDGARELVIIKNGRLIWKGDNIDHVHGIWSCTKSFTSTVLGLLIEDGKCALDTRAAFVLPVMREHYPKVTLRHFTTMTSGYRAVGDETTGSYTHGPSATPFQPNAEPLFVPGTAYAYWDSAMNQIGNVLTRLAGEPLDALFKRRIADPIGMKPSAWKWGDFGVVDGLRVNGGSGNAGKHVQISARELARLGHLFLNKGRWNERQLIPEEWIREATSVQVPAATTNAWTKSGINGPGQYGFNWWRNARGPDGQMLWPGAPADAFGASGHNNNKMFVIPSWRMVIVRLGLDQGDRKWTDAEQGEFLGLVAEARIAQQAQGATAGRLESRRSGDGSVIISGELKQWHKVTLTLDGPFAHERDQDPNPFTDYRMTVFFQHESGSPRYELPGYFAADGNAANTSAESGTKWRAHLSPDKPGRWTYSVSFTGGKHVALEPSGNALHPFHGRSGTFTIAPTDKSGRDFRARGRLQYVGQHHLQFAGTKEYFLKAGPDAPETLLAYEDFDGTVPGRSDVQRQGEAKPKKVLHRYEPHLRDWRVGDPAWKGGKGKGLIGALNYLASKGLNSFSFLPYNAGGDGDNVWPFAAREDKLHYDCSKLDQWGIVFDHATARGLYLHFKLQENEMDDQRRGNTGEAAAVPASLDGGKLGPERKLYCRELIARFAHNLALNWNIGEENTQSTEEVRDMVKFLHETDPYRHHIVIHTYPNQQDKVYTPLLGNNSLLTGASLQNGWNQVHQRTLKWLTESANAHRPWAVANDEQGPANLGVPPDPGYKGHNGIARTNETQKGYTLHDIRKLTLWGNLMAGGAGVEYYFGYQLPENDLVCEDWRSRDQSWDYCRIALEFFAANKIPFWEMKNANALIGNASNDNSKFCLAKAGEVYLVYLPNGGTSEIDLGAAAGRFTVKWFNPRRGGALQQVDVTSLTGGAVHGLGRAPAEPGEDWLVVVRKE